MGQAVSSSGEEDIPASDAAMGNEALAAGSSAPAAADGEEEETAASDAVKGNDAAAAGSSSSSPAANGVKKKWTVRMSQTEVDHILAYTPRPLPTVPDQADLDLPEHVKTKITEAIGEAVRLLRQFHESRLREQEWVRKQLEQKGYVEYEVDDDEGEDYNGGSGVEEVVVLPRRGRRRYRPGVKKTAGGSVKRVN